MSLQESAKKQVEEILDNNMELYAEAFIIPEIRAVSRAANLPDGFINGIQFRKTGKNTGEIINTWGDDKKPLAKWFNDGTPDHDIWSLGEWALHWKGFLGQDIYASTKKKPVHVRGLPNSSAMQIGIALGAKRIKQQVPREVEAEL